MGPWQRPLVYLSKRFDPVAAGRPACIRTVAPTPLLVIEADKLTNCSWLLYTLVRLSWGKCTNTKEDLLIYHGISVLNPASMLPEEDNPMGPLHNCLEVTNLIQSIRPELTNVSLMTTVLFINKSSFIQDRIGCTKAVAVIQDKTIWATS